jgi:hypothetical protein
MPAGTPVLLRQYGVRTSQYGENVFPSPCRVRSEKFAKNVFQCLLSERGAANLSMFLELSARLVQHTLDVYWFL